MKSAFSISFRRQVTVALESKLCDPEDLTMKREQIRRTLQQSLRMKAFQEGKKVHAHIVKHAMQNDTILQTMLISLYSKCGFVDLSRRVFDSMFSRSILTWTALIEGYVIFGYSEEALRVYSLMSKFDLKPNNYVFPCVLKACASLETLEDGRKVHSQVVRSGYGSDLFVGNSLIYMYAKSGFLHGAWQVFGEMQQRDVVTWNAIIQAFLKADDSFILGLFLNTESSYRDHYLQSFWPSQNQVISQVPKKEVEDELYCKSRVGRHKRDVVMNLFLRMQLQGIRPNSTTLSTVLPVFAGSEDDNTARGAHAYVIRNGLEYECFVGNALVEMYVRCGFLEDACKTFNRITAKDVVSWNALIGGYLSFGKCDQALSAFHQMEAQAVNPNVATWNSFIAGFGANGNVAKALEFLKKMQFAGIEPDRATIVNLLKACHRDRFLKEGKQIHAFGIKCGLDKDSLVYTALIDMYAKCQSLNDSAKIFNSKLSQNVISWTAIIGGHAHNGQFGESLKLFNKMLLSTVKPSTVTMATILSVFAQLASLLQGKAIHCHVIKRGFESDIFVGSAVVNMYAKCGSIDDAKDEFETMSKRNIISWNSMISAYAFHGHGHKALSLYTQMEKTGIRPDHITFVGVLSACTHTGLVDTGLDYFNKMSRDYSLGPQAEHYACMVDLLGRAGRLSEAFNLICQMTVEPKPSVWGALLNACRMHKHIDLAETAAKHLFELEPYNIANYILLSHVYAEAGMWEHVAQLRKVIKYRGGMEKIRGRSWIQVDNSTHSFLVGEQF